MTLKELIDEHGFGVWVAFEHSPHVKKFRPLGTSYFSCETVVGEDDGGNPEFFSMCHTSLTLYQPPKQKVKRAQYEYKILKNSLPQISHRLFKNDEEFLRNTINVYWFRRMMETEREFEE